MDTFNNQPLAKFDNQNSPGPLKGLVQYVLMLAMLVGALATLVGALATLVGSGASLWENAHRFAEAGKGVGQPGDPGRDAPPGDNHKKRPAEVGKPAKAGPEQKPAPAKEDRAAPEQKPAKEEELQGGVPLQLSPLTDKWTQKERSELFRSSFQARFNTRRLAEDVQKTMAVKNEPGGISLRDVAIQGRVTKARTDLSHQEFQMLFDELLVDLLYLEHQVIQK